KTGTAKIKLPADGRTTVAACVPRSIAAPAESESGRSPQRQRGRHVRTGRARMDCMNIFGRVKDPRAIPSQHQRDIDSTSFTERASLEYTWKPLILSGSRRS